MDTQIMGSDFQADIDAVGSIAAVPTILEVICRTTGMGFAAIARVTADHWVACDVRDDIDFGLRPGGELRIETTICNEIRASGEPVIINHVAEDPIYCGHPTPALYGFQSYIAMPIVLPDGRFFGTLCALDPRPARLDTPETIGMFRLFAELIAFHLDALGRVSASEAALAAERRTAEAREQFIAVLGHDLRNPLAAIGAGITLLQRTPLNEKAARVAGMMQQSVVRMAALIDNVLDFARGRLAGGLTLNCDATEPLAPVLHQVASELRAGWPDRAVVLDIAVPQHIDCDRTRIAQLFSNLLSNALAYGVPDQPVRVRAGVDAAGFTLSVANTGPPIPPEFRAHLFEPFARGKRRAGEKGLGLGLYIAAEIARAHGGDLDVTSDTNETCFTFRMKRAVTAM